MHNASHSRRELEHALALATRIEALLDVPDDAHAHDEVVVYECRVAHALTLGLVDQLENATRLRGRESTRSPRVAPSRRT